MKVLDINPNCCWSFQGPDRATIELLRLAVAIEDPALRSHVLQNIPNGRAFGFVGDVTKLDFARRFFDEVNLNFTPEGSHQVQLRQCIRRWAKNAVPEEEGNKVSQERWTPFWGRVLRRRSALAGTT